MALPPTTKVWRPDLADTVGGDRVGWIAPPGHFPTAIDGDFLDENDMPNTRTKVLVNPPDDSGNWAVVWWQGSVLADNTRGAGFYSWEYLPWLEVLEYP